MGKMKAKISTETQAEIIGNFNQFSGNCFQYTGINIKYIFTSLRSAMLC
jgi:hypothetical protein